MKRIISTIFRGFKWIITEFIVFINTVEFVDFIKHFKIYTCRICGYKFNINLWIPINKARCRKCNTKLIGLLKRKEQ